MAGADGDRDDDPMEVSEEVRNDELDLIEEERLPWLESDEDYATGDDGGGARILGFVLLGIIALAAFVYLIWFMTHRTPDDRLIADGSTIEAPDRPYKEAPKDPGGKMFDGTGDAAFAVSEGQTRPARLGENSGAPAASPSASASAARPGIDLAPKGTASPRPVASATPGAIASASAAPAGPAIGVQVGAFSTRAAAEAAWSRLSGQYSALSGQRHRVVEGQADIGTVYRLQALPGDMAAANALCGRLKGAGLNCQVKQ